MKLAEWLFVVGYGLITLAFTVCGLALVGFALFEIWQALSPGHSESPTGRLNGILRSIGLLTIAVTSLELGQTVLEEEIRRKVHMSTPTRVRRFLSRFMIVIIVSLAIEFLVAVFEFVHDDPAQLPGAAAIGLATAALLIGWGVFVWLNKHAEELEPEAMSGPSMRITRSNSLAPSLVPSLRTRIVRNPGYGRCPRFTPLCPGRVKL